MLNEIVALDEYVDIQETISTFMAEISLNHEGPITSIHSINRALEKLSPTKFNYLSWQTMDILEEACARHIMATNKLVTFIDIIFKQYPIYTAVAQYLVINNVPEHVYRKLRLYVIANSEEAKAILTMGGL